MVLGKLGKYDHVMTITRHYQRNTMFWSFVEPISYCLDFPGFSLRSLPSQAEQVDVNCYIINL